MQIEQISENEFFSGLNERIEELAEEIAGTAEKIQNNPDSSTYHVDNFVPPVHTMQRLQRIRDKARAFKKHENEEIVYVKRTAPREKPRYYYLPKSHYDKSKLPQLIQELERTQSDQDLGYIH